MDRRRKAGRRTIHEKSMIDLFLDSSSSRHSIIAGGESEHLKVASAVIKNSLESTRPAHTVLLLRCPRLSHEMVDASSGARIRHHKSRSSTTR